MGIEIFDDSAFYWFATTILSITLVPWTIFTAFKQIKSLRKTDSGCKCSFCVRQSGKKKKPQTFSKKSITKLAAFLFLWLLFFRTISLLDFKAKQNQSFDPYKILEIDEGAGKADIKRRYYELSLKLHPDKRKDTKDAETEKQYILIKKAYQSLTDPQAIENYEKHGHPDGFQGISVTIGLPSFLSAKGNEGLVLVAYIAFLFATGGSAYLWWKRYTSFGRNGILNDTTVAFAMSVHASSEAKHFTELLSLSREFKNMSPPTDPKEFQGLFLTAMKQNKLSKANYVPYINYVWTIQCLHFNRIKTPIFLKTDRAIAISTIFRLIKSHFETMSKLETWQQKTFFSFHNDPALKQKLSSVAVPLKPILSLLSYSQRLCQRQSFDSDSLEQIPFFTGALIRSLRKGKIGSVNDILRLFSISDGGAGSEPSPDKLAANAEAVIVSELKQNARMLSDINEFLSSVSDIQIVITRDSKVVTETSAKEGEAIKLKLLFRRLDRVGTLGCGKEGNEGKELEKARPPVCRKGSKKLAHCPFLPVEKEEEWALLVSPQSGQTLVSAKWLDFGTSGCDELELEIPAFAGPKRRFVDIAVVSDSYVDVMKSVRFHYEVEAADEEEPEVEQEVDEAPKELNDEPESLFSFTACDMVLIPITLLVFALVFPETDWGKSMVAKGVGMFRRLVSAFGGKEGKV